MASISLFIGRLCSICSISGTLISLRDDLPSWIVSITCDIFFQDLILLGHRVDQLPAPFVEYKKLPLGSL